MLLLVYSGLAFFGQFTHPVDEMKMLVVLSTFDQERQRSSPPHGQLTIVALMLLQSLLLSLVTSLRLLKSSIVRLEVLSLGHISR